MLQTQGMQWGQKLEKGHFCFTLEELIPFLFFMMFDHPVLAYELTYL